MRVSVLAPNVTLYLSRFFIMATYPGNGDKCDTIQYSTDSICNGTKYVALVQWQTHALPGSLFDNSICANLVFERSTDREWQKPSITSSEGQGGSLEQVARVLASQRQELFVNNNCLLERIGITVIYDIYL